MAFQIKDFASISASMVNWLKGVTQKVTDFNIGSVVRTMLEAVAIEIDELYQQMFIGIKEAIPVSVYNSFSFSAIQALPSSGLIRVTITTSTNPTLIPSGTTFSYAGSAITFTSSADVTISAGGTYADVQVAATTSGSASNIPANIAFVMSPQPSNFVSATNLSAFINGQDAETPDQQKIRFNAYIQSLERGTVAALKYGLSLAEITDSQGNVIERVQSSSVVEPWLTDNTQPIALVNCYIHNGVGNTSSALVTQAQNVIYGYTDANNNKVPGWKAAGVDVTVAAATEIIINIGGVVTAAPGYDKPTLDLAANSVANTYLLSLGIGETFEVAELIRRIMETTGVQNFIPADVAIASTPALGQTAGGTIAATTYYVAATYITPNGETLPSPTQSLAVSANNLLTVASPPLIGGVTGWNVYVGTSPTSLTKQNTALLAIGTTYTEPISGLIAGSALPTVSTARLVDVVATSSKKFMPGTMTIA